MTSCCKELAQYLAYQWGFECFMALSHHTCRSQAVDHQWLSLPQSTRQCEHVQSAQILREKSDLKKGRWRSYLWSLDTCPRITDWYWYYKIVSNLFFFAQSNSHIFLDNLNVYFVKTHVYSNVVFFINSIFNNSTKYCYIFNYVQNNIWTYFIITL